VAELKSSKRKSLANAAITTAALLAGLVLVNVVFQGVTQRVDLSGEALTRASELLVAGLDEPLVVTAYFGKVPTENRYEQEFVESLLDQYADASDGKLQWKKIDPFERGREFQQKLREDEGIDKVMWLSIVDDSPQQVPVYFHVQFKYLDKTEVWMPPGRFSLKGLEYQFSSIIKKLAYPKKQVAITAGFGSPPQAQAIQQVLADQYEVQTVDLSQAGADLAPFDILVVNGPTEPLSEAAKLAIDGHVLAGKSTLFLLRGMAFQVPGSQPGLPTPPNQPVIGMPASSGLEDMLKTWGVEVKADVILDDRANTPGAVIAGQEGLVVKPLFPLAEALAVGEGDPLQGLSLVPVPFASTVALVGGLDAERVQATELLRTSPYSWARADILPVTAESQFARKDEPTGPFSVGWALRGRFASAFGAADAEGNAQESPANTRIVVLGSAAIVDDVTLGLSRRHPLFRNLAVGATVLMNLVDWLAADQALVAARSKGAPPPIEELAGDTKTLVKYGNIVGASLVILLAGVVAWFVRERRRRNLRL
jgi:ABC-type uncharacterized transport system involved in gliding motility auxiliary subunit